MSEVTTYACDVNGCQQMAQKAVSFEFAFGHTTDNGNNFWVIRFSSDPKEFERHACCFKHLSEYFANECDKIERSIAHG